MVIRLVRNTQTSTLKPSRQWRGGRVEDSQLPTSSSIVPTQKRRRSFRVWRWSLLWLSILTLLGISVTSGVLWLTKVPPPIDCQRMTSLSADGDRLYCAQIAAESGKLEYLVAAIRLVEPWRSNHPLYPEGQRMMVKWSEAILESAQQKIKQGDLSAAVAIASKVPVSSPLYPEAQAEIATWKQEWKWADEIVKKFKDALKGQNWQQASQLIASLQKSKWQYWSISRVDALMQELGAQKEAWEQLEEARELAKSNKLAQLEEAIALAAKVSPSSYVKAQAQVEQSRWIRTLLQIAAMLWKNKDFSGLIRVLERVPVNTSLYQEAQDWIRLGRAAEAAKKDNILALVDALAAVRQIEPKSPIHQLASQQATLWQSQLQDHAQLQLAQFAASFEQRAGLQIAIDKAQTVAPGHPRRLLAQTLIAQWRKQIQQIEDRSKLLNAQQLAEEETLEQLKAAVEMASNIQLGQPLRLEAQSAIAKWNRKIQTIEDKPILDLAQALAQRRDFIAAISTASQIRSDRALYSQAQEAMQEWVAQVQMAQDRPILEAAAALAAQGRFDAAITTASQIPPERPLYGEAQGAIASWTSQKAAISGETQSAFP